MATAGYHAALPKSKWVYWPSKNPLKIRVDPETIRKIYKQSRNKVNAVPPLDPGTAARIQALELFQASATQSMNNMAIILKKAAKADDIDVLLASLF